MPAGCPGDWTGPSPSRRQKRAVPVASKRAEKYRIRQGNYRILYTIEDKIVTVTIVKIGHRREVYGGH